MLNNELWNNPSAGAYEIAYSARLDFDSNSYLNFSPSTATSRDVMTMSFWFKIGGTAGASGNKHVFLTSGTSGSAYAFLELDTNHKINGSEMTGIAFGASDETFSDTSVWYHMVYRYDSSQGTQANRLRIYINGTQITLGSTSNFGSGEDHPYWNASNMYIGNKSGIGHTVEGADFVFADWIFIDGSSLAPTSFANDDTGSWLPIDPSDLTFGNNGFWLDFAINDDLGNDVSGNNNDWTANNMGTDHRITDTPTNPA